MRAVRQRAASVLILCLLFILFTVHVDGQQLKIHVGENVQVSVANAQKNHGEVLMGADPTNPNRLIGCSMIFPDPLTRRISDGVTYASDDGGVHWKQTLYVDEKSQLMSTGDPACDFGPDGKAYSVYLQPAIKPEADDVLVYQSNDGGATWEAPSHIDWIDREYVTVDTTGGKYNGRIYINGTGSAGRMDHGLGDIQSTEIGISIQHSTDGGKTFDAPLKRFSTPQHWVLGMGNGAVLSDGTYIAIFGEQVDRSDMTQKRPAKPDAMLKMISSTDGGISFSPASVISPWYMNYGNIGTTSSIVPTVAVDRSHGPFRDRLYVVWPDYRSGRGEILLSYSKDKGKTWSKPHVVDDDRAWPAPAVGPDDIMPVVDVNRDGVVGVSWYDRRDNPHNLGWWVRFSASNDGGETFSPSVRVSSAPDSIRLGPEISLEGTSNGGGKPGSRTKGGNLQVRVGYGTFFTFNGGHTGGMAADAGGRFHPFWIDNRTGVEQIWTAAVTVDGAATMNGSKDLAEMKDVSEKVTLDLKNGKYDRATSTVSIEAYLGNTSDETLKGPIKLRVLSLDSKMGALEIENAENHEKGQGAVWDFSTEVPNAAQGLAPDEVTKPKRLTFKLTGTMWGANPPKADDLQSFVNFEAKALAADVVGEKKPQQ